MAVDFTQAKKVFQILGERLHRLNHFASDSSCNWMQAFHQISKLGMVQLLARITFGHFWVGVRLNEQAINAHGCTCTREVGDTVERGKAIEDAVTHALGLRADTATGTSRAAPGRMLTAQCAAATGRTIEPRSTSGMLA